jgi:hypothetical protein
MRLCAVLPVTLALLAGCAGRGNIPNASRSGEAAWPSLAPRPGEAMPMVVRRVATQRCAQLPAAADCAAGAPVTPITLPQAEPPLRLEAALAALEADIAAAEAAVPAAQARASAGPADAASRASAEAALAAGQAQLVRATLAGIAIRAAELDQRLRDNPSGLPLQPRLAALRARLDRLEDEPDR